jgi:hypothetical protein
MNNTHLGVWKFCIPRKNVDEPLIVTKGKTTLSGVSQLVGLCIVNKNVVFIQYNNRQVDNRTDPTGGLKICFFPINQGDSKPKY